MNQIKKILKNIPYLRSSYVFLNRKPTMVLSDALWIIAQYFKKVRLFITPKSKLIQLKNELEITHYDKNCLITITLGSFHIGNRDCLLPKLFKSFIHFTQTPLAFEFLIKLDEGDDYIFYHKQKKKYDGKLNIRFFVTPRGRGYADSHLWHSSLILHRSPTSKAVYILSEDAEFCLKNWDEELLQLVLNRKNTFFIATSCTLEKAISIHGPNPKKPIPVYWIGGEDFPILGFDLVNSAEEFTKNYSNWVSLGNLFNVDSYSADLLRIAWTNFQVNFHEQIKQYSVRKGVFSWSENPERRNIRTKTLIEFFQHDNIKIREELVHKIIEDLNFA